MKNKNLHLSLQRFVAPPLSSVQSAEYIFFLHGSGDTDPRRSDMG